MRNVMLYKVYEGEQLKLSTILEEEADDYMKMVFDFNGVKCEKETTEVTPIDHLKRA